MSNLRIGILAEDATDSDAIKVIIQRLVANKISQMPKIRERSDGGCGNLRKKAKVWMQEFSDKGYDAVILLHDLDRWKELGVHKDRESLYQKLANIPVPSNIKQFICIPIEELEAWFWCDQNIIDKLARGKSKEKPHSSPHKIVKPKEKLIELSGKYGRPFYDTNMNKELAAILDLELCSQTCPAFQGLKDFILSLCI